MNLPMPIVGASDASSISLWNNVYEPSKAQQYDKTLEEGLWRRTQNFNNRSVSGWKAMDDKRRKLLHYQHQYDLLYTDVGRPYIALVATYVYMSFTLPKDELRQHLTSLRAHFKQGLWMSDGLPQDMTYTRQSLKGQIRHHYSGSKPAFECMDFPPEYETIELTIASGEYPVTAALQKKPWTILKTGMRLPQPRSSPRYIKTPHEMFDHFPAQVMLGCGPSSEAGVFPLHHLHDLYGISDPCTKEFIFDIQKDRFVKEIILCPEMAYQKMTDVFTKILTAQPTDFYYVLKDFYDRGFFVGPIITNNFDGIHLRFGLPEINVRKYEEAFIAPEIEFDSRARSLFVIGSHADRRRIEQRARRQGLRILYMDPEEWIQDGVKIPYPLESPQVGDLVYQNTASEGFRELYQCPSDIAVYPRQQSFSINRLIK